MRKLALTLILAVIFASSLTLESPVIAQDAGTSAAADRLTPSQAKSIIAGRAREVVRALKYKEMLRLAAFVHPVKGLRFSQYGTVSMESDRVFSKSQLVNLFKSNRRYLWGEYDGSGDPIRLSAKQYFRKFVYRQDMLKAKDISYNENAAGGNTMPNVFDAYPRAIIVVYHHAGSDPRFDGMDWQQLWLAFEKRNETWYLVGIVSHEWTI